MVAQRFGFANQWWKARSRHGVKPKFPVGEVGARMLQEACEDYFEYCMDNPLIEDKPMVEDKCIVHEEVPHLMVFTLSGLQLFVDVSQAQWNEWRTSRPDLAQVISWAEQTIRTQKFVGATAGFFNATIIARDLGLADKREVSGPDGGPIETINGEMTPQEAAEMYARTREQGK